MCVFCTAATFLWVADVYFTLPHKQHSRRALIKSVLKMCSKFTGKHPCRGISIKLLCKVTLCHGCFPVNSCKFLYIFRTPFPKSTFCGLLQHSDFRMHMNGGNPFICHYVICALVLSKCVALFNISSRISYVLNVMIFTFLRPKLPKDPAWLVI